MKNKKIILIITLLSNEINVIDIFNISQINLKKNVLNVYNLNIY